MKKKIAILGAGEAGMGAAMLANQLGYEVFVSDSGNILKKNQKILEANKIIFEEGRHTSQIILECSEIIKSPGISAENLIIKLAELRDVPVISEIEFAFRYNQTKLIAVTGTNGKSTFSYTLLHILTSVGFKTKIVGNVGKSFCKELLSDELFDYYIVECSSYQLENILTFRPEIALILNIGQDHLDRYNLDIIKYANAKFNLINNMKAEDLFLYYNTDRILEKKVEATKFNCKTVGIGDDLILETSLKIPLINDNNETYLEVDLVNLPVYGKHQCLNFIFSCIVCQKLRIDLNEVINAMKTFKGVAHRMELIKTIKNVNYVNDSKALNIEAVELALGSFGKTRNIIWIAGGLDKGNDFTKLLKIVSRKVKMLICCGSNSTLLQNIFQSQVSDIQQVNNIEAAVTLASINANPYDVVLFSTGSLPNDMYKDFQERGDAFKKAVNKIQQ